MTKSDYGHKSMLSTRLTVAIVVTALILGLSACSPGREERMQSRFEDFMTVLPESAKGALEDGNFALAASLVDSTRAADTAFASKWSALKKSEAIELFSTADVIDYFVTYFGTDQYRSERQ